MLIWLMTYKNSGTRGIFSSLGHLAIVVLGWLVGKWAGIILISFPLLVFYYYLLFHIAMVVVPVATPESWRERWQRFKFFLWYRWGFQYPVWVVTDPSGREIEQRISGSFGKLFAPGLVLARSHQVVGLTSGITFSGIREPGVVFTRAFERPFGVVDLRTQLRTSWIEVVSSDGIPYKVLLFTAFAADKERWNLDFYHRALRKDDLYKAWKEPDFNKGSYPFSKPRLRALFSTVGVNTSPVSGQKVAFWDERVLYQIEQATREILSQKRLDELWLSQNDRADVNATDEIARAINEKCSFLLQERGVRLYTSRIVNFEFSVKESPDQKGISDVDFRNMQGRTGDSDGKTDDSIVQQQQIKVWRADWQREAAQTRAQGEAEAELLKQEARAYAYATLLTAVAEGMQKTRQLNPDLLPRVIAMRFIGALDELVKQQPEGAGRQEAYAAYYSLKQIFSKFDG